MCTDNLGDPVGVDPIGGAVFKNTPEGAMLNDAVETGNFLDPYGSEKSGLDVLGAGPGAQITSGGKTAPGQLDPNDSSDRNVGRTIGTIAALYFGGAALAGESGAGAAGAGAGESVSGTYLTAGESSALAAGDVAGGTAASVPLSQQVAGVSTDAGATLTPTADGGLPVTAQTSSANDLGEMIAQEFTNPSTQTQAVNTGIDAGDAAAGAQQQPLSQQISGVSTSPGATIQPAPTAQPPASPGIIDSALQFAQKNPTATMLLGQTLGGLVKGSGDAAAAQDLAKQKMEQEKELLEWKRRFTQGGSYFDSKLPFQAPGATRQLKRPNGSPVYDSNGIINSARR